MAGHLPADDLYLLEKDAQVVAQDGMPRDDVVADIAQFVPLCRFQFKASIFEFHQQTSNRKHLSHSSASRIGTDNGSFFINKFQFQGINWLLPGDAPVPRQADILNAVVSCRRSRAELGQDGLERGNS